MCSDLLDGGHLDLGLLLTTLLVFGHLLGTHGATAAAADDASDDSEEDEDADDDNDDQPGLDTVLNGLAKITEIDVLNAIVGANVGLADHAAGAVIRPVAAFSEIFGHSVISREFEV